MLQWLKKAWSDTRWGADADLSKTTGNVGLATRRSLSRALSPTESAEVSIAVHRAVNSIAGNISQAEWRLYTRSGREITGGPLFDLLKRPYPRMARWQMVYEMISWACIWGEFALWVSNDLKYLLPLAPPKLQIDVPTPGRVKNRESVAQWRYTWCDGEQSLIPDSKLIFDATFNPNPHEPVRGLSPLTVGATQISAAHYATRYNQQFFENNAVPSHIIALAGGIGRSNRQEIERKYQQEFSGWAGNAHKVMMISGVDEVKHIPIESAMDDAKFLDLQQYADLKVAMLYGVPPIEMGIFDKTRYDSAPMERQTYVESVLKPIMMRMQCVFQFQLIEPYFSFSDFTTEKPKVSKRWAEKFEKARYEQADSPIILLIDADTLPIMSQVKASQIEQAQKFRDTAMMSATEIIDYFSLDVPHREERDDIFVLNTYSNYTNPEKNPAYFMQQAAAAEEAKHNAAGGDGAGTNEKKSYDAEARRAAGKLLRELRRLTLAQWEMRALWSLADADDLARRHGVDARRGVRKLRNQLRRIVSAFPAEQVYDEFKFVLNRTKPEHLLGGAIVVSRVPELDMAELLENATRPQPSPQPQVNVTMPPITVNLPQQSAPITVSLPDRITLDGLPQEQQPQAITVNIPQQPAPVVNMAAPETPQVTLAPVINLPEMQPTINVQAAPAPSVTVNPQIDVHPADVKPTIKVQSPQVNVEVPPEKDKRVEIERDRDGKIKGARVRSERSQ